MYPTSRVIRTIGLIGAFAFVTLLTRLEATVEAQAAQIRKVSDSLETQAPAPRVVANQ